MSIEYATNGATTDIQTPPHLLIVDEYESSLIMQHIFGVDYHLTCVNDDQSALNMFDQDANADPYDAIIVDMAGDEVNGLRLLEKLRSRRHRDIPPLIMLSDTEALEKVPRGFELGANDYITKPVDRDVALARVEAQIKLHQQLLEQEARLAQLEAERAQQTRLVKMVTHDLKHPVNNIRMAENMLRHYAATDAASAGLMDSVLAALDSMQEMLDDFNDAYNLTSGVQVEVGPLPVCQIMTELGLEYMAPALRKGITIEVEPCDFWVISDQRRLRRSLGNLLSNAVKYSPPNTQITVRASMVADEIRIAVTDEGPGVLPEERHLLYTEFGKLSNRPTGQEASTGLGLWIVKLLVEAMGGCVGYDAPESGGSTFWLQFPAASMSHNWPMERITDEMPAARPERFT